MRVDGSRVVAVAVAMMDDWTTCHSNFLLMPVTVVFSRLSLTIRGDCKFALQVKLNEGDG